MSKVTAVILCGPGHALWPIQRPPKALLPVCNRPLVEGVLKWVEEAGLADVLMLAPTSQQGALSHYLRSRRQKESKSLFKIDLEVFDAEEVQGTARVVAWAASKNLLRGDFVLLPCDLAIRPSPSNTANALASLLQSFRRRDDLVTSLYFERPSTEKEKDGQLITLWEPETHTLLDMKALADFHDEIVLRGSLFDAFPRAKLSTRLLPAHVYACSARVLDVLAKINSFDSFKTDFVPFLAKAQWQRGLLEHYNGDSTPLLEMRHPQALALSHSSTTPVPEKQTQSKSSTTPSRTSDRPLRPTLRNVKSSVYGTLLTSAYSSNDVRPSDASPRPPLDAVLWPRSNAVTIHIWKPEDGICTRVHSIASYAEINRMALKATPEPEGVLGHHLAVGEKASIKRCAIDDNCSIGKMARLSGCVLMENVAVGEGAKLDGCIIGSNVRIGDNAVLSGCEIGEGTIVDAGVVLKGEKLSHD